MQVKLEIIGSESIQYTDKKTLQKASFDVLHAREAMPASVLLPFRLSKRDFPDAKPGSTLTLTVTEMTRAKGGTSIDLRGQVVAAGK